MFFLIFMQVQGFHGAKMPVKIWDVFGDNKVISKLVEIKNNLKYLIGHLYQVIRPLVLRQRRR